MRDDGTAGTGVLLHTESLKTFPYDRAPVRRFLSIGAASKARRCSSRVCPVMPRSVQMLSSLAESEPSAIAAPPPMSLGPWHGSRRDDPGSSRDTAVFTVSEKVKPKIEC